MSNRLASETFRDALRDTFFLQEVLTKMLLRADVHHAVCTTSSRVRKATNFPA